MPKSPQDIYARHLLSPRGYPLWTPEPSHQLLAYRRDGLRIGDVGVVIPEDGCFDVFFNICLPRSHPFHQATGVPDNFEPVELSDMDIRTVINAENPGRIIATSSVKTVRTSERSGDTLPRTRSSGLEYEFNLSSSEGALLILPEGAERHDLRNHHRFLEAATQHGANWYRFAEEKVGQIIGHDSLYLITGLYKSRSWSLAAFEKTAGSGEYPAQFRHSQVGGDNIVSTCMWDTARALDWRVGPIDNYGIPNQAVFIRGFKIAHRTGMFGTRWISVKADAPSARPNSVKSFGAAPGESLLGYVFGGLSTGKITESSRSGVQDEIAANPALDTARNEIQNNGALAVGEHVVIQCMPEASQAFHPSDIINRHLLNKEPSADIAITHDNEWITLLEENLLQTEDMVQEDLLETLVSQNYHIISEAGVVYLQSRDSDPDTFNDNKVDAVMEGQEHHSKSPAITVANAIPSTEQEDVMAQWAPRDTPHFRWTNLDRIVESSSSISSKLLDHLDDEVIPDSGSGSKEENSSFISSRWNRSQTMQIRNSNKGSPLASGQRMTGEHGHHGPTTRGKMTQSTSSMPWVPPRPNWTDNFATNPSMLSPSTQPEPLPIAPVSLSSSEVYQVPWRNMDGFFADRYSGSLPEPVSGKNLGENFGGASELHPLLAASPDERGEYPNWNMCFRAHKDNFGIASIRSWVEARNAPAIEPRLRCMNIICRAFPGTIRAYAQQDPMLGVTCGDVLDAIFAFLDGDMQWEEYEQFMRERHKVTATPGTGDTLKRSRWLGSDWVFGGLAANDAFVKERYRDLSLTQAGWYWELICLPESS